jgi:hypothetical protein
MKEETFIEPTVKDVRDICRKYELGSKLEQTDETIEADVAAA